jgi:uncharacterized membrane protein
VAPNVWTIAQAREDSFRDRLRLLPIACESWNDDSRQKHVTEQLRVAANAEATAVAIRWHSARAAALLVAIVLFLTPIVVTWASLIRGSWLTAVQTLLQYFGCFLAIAFVVNRSSKPGRLERVLGLLLACLVVGRMWTFSGPTSNLGRPAEEAVGLGR